MTFDGHTSCITHAPAHPGTNSRWGVFRELLVKHFILKRENMKVIGDLHLLRGLRQAAANAGRGLHLFHIGQEARRNIRGLTMALSHVVRKDPEISCASHFKSCIGIVALCIA